MDEKYMFELQFFLKKLESGDHKLLVKLIETNPAGTVADLTPRAGFQSHKAIVKGSGEHGREVHV